MNFVREKAKAVGIVPSTKDGNCILYAAVAAGDPAAREEMISRNLPLVAKKVRDYLGRFPHFKPLRDDLASAGFLALTKAVDAICRGALIDSPHPTSYLSTSIQRAIEEAADSEVDPLVPSRTRRHARRTGVPVWTLTRSPHRAEELRLTVDPFRLCGLRDLIDDCCESDRDRKLVRMREEGYTYAEIADVLQQSASTIHDADRRIYRRFLRLSGLKGTK